LQCQKFGVRAEIRGQSELLPKSALTPNLPNLQYNLNQQVALTAEYERYGKSKDFGAKADVWTVGARYSF
jgi:hypothetical protein